MPGAILEYFKRRATSTVLVAYTIFWGIWHWRAIYATFFVDQAYIYERCGIFKDRYVSQFVGLHFGTNQFWMDLLGYVVPALLAVGYVCLLPKLTNLCYKRELHFKNERRMMKIKAEAKLIEVEQAGVQKQTEKVEAEIKLKKKEVEVNELRNPEEAWSKEFDDLVKTDKGRSALEDLKILFYEYHGNMFVNGERKMTSDSNMICDTHELMSYDDALHEYYLTNKGKYIMKLFADAIANGSLDMDTPTDDDIDLDDIPF